MQQNGDRIVLADFLEKIYQLDITCDSVSGTFRKSLSKN